MYIFFLLNVWLLLYCHKDGSVVSVVTRCRLYGPNAVFGIDSLSLKHKINGGSPAQNERRYQAAPVQRQTWLLRNGGAQLGTRRRQCVCRGYDVTPLECANRRGGRGGGGARGGGGSGAPAVRRVTSLLLAHAQHGSPGATRNCSTPASVAHATKSQLPATS
ncbi:hypothetical protein ISCGN_028183 [Ixodes scapularis]